MHYRVRGNSVQLVKTVREEGSDKAQSRPVGSINMITGELNAAALAALTPQEVAAAQAWILNRSSVRDRCYELEFLTLSARLTELADWVRRADDELIAPHTDDIIDSLSGLRKAMLNRNGIRRPARPQS